MWVKVRQYEGGIYSHTEEVWVPAALMRAFDDLPCTCRGEAHDECRECDECLELLTDCECEED